MASFCISYIRYLLIILTNRKVHKFPETCKNLVLTCFQDLNMVLVVTDQINSSECRSAGSWFFRTSGLMSRLNRLENLESENWL